MLLKTQKIHAQICALLIGSALSVVQVSIVTGQVPPAAPAVQVSPATLEILFSEAEAALASKDYKIAISKIQELLAGLGNNKDAPLELLNFNIGLAHLLDGNDKEAEIAFKECLKKFPKGEYASRCYLGIGRASVRQNTPEKKQVAVEALKLAAQDPKLRSEAGLSLGQVYIDLDKRDEAMAIFKSLMGSDIRTPQQTTAAVEVIGLLADAGDLNDLINYLDRLKSQAGIRDVVAWYANQVLVRGDELVNVQAYETALAIFRSVPPRSQILEIQTNSLNAQRRDVQILESRVAAEKDKPLAQRSKASELISELKPAIDLAEKALAAIQEKTDLDAVLLMRRGRCLFNLQRYEEALLSFRTIRTKHPKSIDAPSAGYAEIIILSRLKNVAEVKARCDDFIRNHPTSENAEQVATLAGEVLIQNEDWKEVANFYRELESKFPNSSNLDRYIFFQGVALFQDGNLKEAIEFFKKFKKNYPESSNVESATYYLVLCYFQTNAYKETLASCKEYLSLFPDGNYIGDIRYRLAFIDSNDKEVDQSDKIIGDLTKFLNQYPNDAAAGSMHCLVADTYKKKKSDKSDELGMFQKLALESYKKAILTDSPDSIVQYALESATAILQDEKDWAGIAALHADVIKRKPDTGLALLSASWVAKMKAREGKNLEAAEILANAVKPRIGDPANEQVEFLIDELVKTLVPRKKFSEIDIDVIDKQLVDTLNKVIVGQENATTNARLYYARARLAMLVRRGDRADVHLKGIAIINAKDPSVLSPSLLAASGDILLKEGLLDEAEGMYKRLIDRHKDGMFSDAGPVGLGNVALARKQPEEALRIFEDALEQNPGMSRFKEANLGKLNSMLALDQLEKAKVFALSIVGDKSFRGETAGKVYVILGKIYREQSKKAATAEAKMDLLATALATYKRVTSAYKSSPEVCAEAYWQAYETTMEQGDKKAADEYLTSLANDPKLINTQRSKQAAPLVK
jgi:tetratricopeptide (TPR) repeat protein